MAPRRTSDEAAATRDGLIDAALEVFAERGYSTAQLEEIAARAQVTRGALYHHFENKADLYMAVMSERWPRSMAQLWPTLEGEGPSRERVRAFAAAFCTALERDASVRALLQMAAHGSAPEIPGGLRAKAQSMQTWVDNLTRAIASDHKQAAARQAAVAVLAFLHGVVIVVMAAPALISPARDADRLAAACVDGAID